MPSKEQYETLFNRVIGYKEQKSSLSADIKDAYESFATSNELDVKGVKKAFASYEKILKDRAKFILEEAAYDAVTEALLQEPDPF
jgi:uncharacterized protein (UPF0335 family)